MLCFLLVALVPLGVSSWLTLRSSERRLQEELEGGLTSVAIRQTRAITQFVRERQRDALVLANNPLIGSIFQNDAVSSDTDRARIDSFLAFALEESPFEDLLLVDPAGRVIYSGKDPAVVGRSLLGFDSALSRLVHRARATLGVEVSDYETTPEGNQLIAYIAAPAFSNRRTVGLVILQLKNAGVFGVINDYTGLGETGETQVITLDDGNLWRVGPSRHHPNGRYDAVAQRGEEPPLLRRVASGLPAIGRYVDERGEEVYSVARYLPHLRWGLVVKMDTDEAFGAIISLRQTTLTFLLVTAGVTVLLATIVARNLSQPIRKLTAAAERAAAGDLSSTISVKSHNEIGTLAGTFNTMTGRLRATLAELADANRTLEAKVEERTAQLQSKNSELEAAMRRVTETQRQLLQQEKLASLGQLTAGVAHEIKNPLNFVCNFSNVTVELARDLDALVRPMLPAMTEDDRADALELMAALGNNLEKIGGHARRADGIVKNMLEHAKPGGGEARTMDFNGLVKEFARLAQHGVRAKNPALDAVELKLELDTAVPAQSLRPQDFSRVVINLVTNALQGVADRSLALAKEDDPHAPAYAPEVTVITRLFAHAVELRVRDNGAGIASGLRDRVFTPFFTTRPTGQGTGLGLSISYDIVTNGHGGTMSFTSIPNEVTEFTVVLPRKDGNAS